MHDQNHFMEPPRVVATGDRFFLTFTYGSMGFFFEPEYRIDDGKLVFFLSGTSSSGHLTGTSKEIEVIEAKAKDLVRLGQVFWEEPGRVLVPLQVLRASRK